MTEWFVFCSGLLTGGLRVLGCFGRLPYYLIMQCQAFKKSSGGAFFVVKNLPDVDTLAETVF